MRLQLGNVLPAVILHEGSCERRAEPRVFRDLIAANVDPRRGKQTTQLVEHRLQKIVSLRHCRIEGIVWEAVETSIDADLRRIPQFRERLQQGITVSRDI